MKSRSLFLSAALCLLVAGCVERKSQSVAPYLDPTLSVQARVSDLLGRMTLQEKIGQMDQYCGQKYAKSVGGRVIPEINQLIKEGAVGSFIFVLDPDEANEYQRLTEESRLRIPLLFCLDAVHGMCPIGGATVFPSPIGIGCSFDTEIAEWTTAITAKEMRALGIQWALHPMLGIAQEPRWGRTAELFGEDPYLTSQMARATVRGFQGRDLSSPDSVLACIKTFVAHSIPPGGRGLGPSDVSERTLRNIFFPPYQAAVEEGVFTLMPAYHDINGIPCHASEELLTRILRDEWGFRGFVVSDWGGVEQLVRFHRTAVDQKEAVRQAVSAGVDIHMAGGGFGNTLKELVEQGVISEQRIDRSVAPILEAKFRLGIFENRYVDPSKADETLFHADHRQAALEAARKSLVLLENNGRLLPLAKDKDAILVTGPNADDFAQMGDWTGPQPEQNIVTVLEGIRNIVSPSTKVRYVDVGKNWQIGDKQIADAVRVAKKCSAAIVVIGGDHTRFDDEGKFDRKRKERTGGEGTDRASINLVGRQLDLVRAIHRTGTPVVVVLINGRPLSIPWIAENVPAILEAWEPGSMGGQAVAEALFGEYNPGGRLAISFPVSVGQVPVYYNHLPSSRTRYKDISWEPLYEFGHGLSYTTFEYSKLTVPRTIERDREVEIAVEVRNSGERAGDEVVLLYVNDVVSSVTTPLKELKGFKRVSLQPGEKKEIRFQLPFGELALLNREMKRVVEPGAFEIMIGGLKEEIIVE